MSLRFLKVSEQILNQAKLNEMMQPQKKKLLDDFPPNMYILCEGVKTEPNYLSGFAAAINSKFSAFSSRDRIRVKGTGRNTRGLLRHARSFVEKEFPQAAIVWLVYDRDDFPPDVFDNTQYSAEDRQDARTYRVAWSNECFELWFVLHFQDLNADNGRRRYLEILREKFGYEKNMENLYEMLKDKTEIAVRRARRQYESYGDAPPSQRCPATRVYELVEELQKYL